MTLNEWAAKHHVKVQRFSICKEPVVHCYKPIDEQTFKELNTLSDYKIAGIMFETVGLELRR